jgi:hypothetical protein
MPAMNVFGSVNKCHRLTLAMEAIPGYPRSGVEADESRTLLGHFDAYPNFEASIDLGSLPDCRACEWP